MVFNYSLLQNGFPPLVIEKETKDEYIEFLGNQDLDGFVCGKINLHTIAAQKYITPQAA